MHLNRELSGPCGGDRIGALASGKLAVANFLEGGGRKGEGEAAGYFGRVEHATIVGHDRFPSCNSACNETGVHTD